jgi:hypothetical protein
VKGFITGPLLYVIAGMGAALLLSWGAVAVQTWRLDAAEGEIAAFHAVSKAQEEANKKKAEGDAKLKKEKDDETKRKLAAADLRYKRLLDSSGRISLPAPESPGNPDLACFDRTQFLGAINGFLAEVAGLAHEGDQKSIGLDTARTWVNELLRRQ